MRSTAHRDILALNFDRRKNLINLCLSEIIYHNFINEEVYSIFMIKASKKWKDWWTVWIKHEKYILLIMNRKNVWWTFLTIMKSKMIS
jgi:hypothetical protein